MKEALPAVGFRGPNGRAFTVEVAEPFTILWVGKVLEGVVVNLLVPRGEITAAGVRPAQ